MRFGINCTKYIYKQILAALFNQKKKKNVANETKIKEGFNKANGLNEKKNASEDKKYQTSTYWTISTIGFWRATLARYSSLK